MGPEPLAYDNAGTEVGNKYKIEKEVRAYDEDIKVTLDYLSDLDTCTGKMGAIGFCLGGHVAFRVSQDDGRKFS